MWSDFIVILLAITSILLLLVRDWRWNIGVLAAQYLGVFLLVSLQWPLGMALTKLVVGWMAGAALGLTRLSHPPIDDGDTSWTSRRLFQLLAACLVLIAVFSLAPGLQDWLPGISYNQILAGLILIAIGLLHLGMTTQPFRVVLGLLTVMAGFETLYAAVEISLLVAGLLAGINLGLALVGIYLLSMTSEGTV